MLYICTKCDRCLFHDKEPEFGDSCYYYTKEGEYPQPLRWISSCDIQRDPNLLIAYHRSCPAFVSKEDILKEKKIEVTQLLAIIGR